MRFSSILALSLLIPCASLHAQAPWRTDLSQLVVVGDSISAGVENFSLLDSQQVHGYASVIAAQAGVNLSLPLVPPPGIPDQLQILSTSPLTIGPVSNAFPSPPRENACQQPANVSVPGINIQQALTMKPHDDLGSDLAALALGEISPVQIWADVVLGFPNPLGYAGGCPTTTPPPPPQTEIQQAVAFQPTAIIEWLGNNDILVPALTGALSTITPISSFAASYDAVLDSLQATKAPILTATVPDVTKIPYFTPVSALAAQAHTAPQIVAAKLGIGTGDLLRATAVPIATAILSGQTAPSSWPASCPAPALDLPVNTVPCVLTAADAAYVRATVDSYNFVIFLSSLEHGATLVDTHGLVNQLAQTGYDAAGKHLTTAFLGGLISLDGIHPTNTGYAIIANYFIDVMNRSWRTAIPHADINAIALQDPLFPFVNSSGH